MDTKEMHNKNASSSLSSRFAALMLVNFTGSLGFSIVMPFLIFLVHQWGGNALIYGLVGAAYSVFQFIGSPILGRWSDLYGRRRVLFLSQMGTTISWCIVLLAFYLPNSEILNVDSSFLGKFSLTLPLILLFIGRSVDGLTGGNVSVANAYVADITPENERESKFGKMAAVSNLGYIIGPALAGLLGATILGYELPVLFALGVSLIATILIIVGLPKKDPNKMEFNQNITDGNKVMGQEHKSCIQAKDNSKISNLELIRLPGISVLLVIYFLVMLAFNFFYVAFPVQAATDMHWTVKHTGTFFAVMSLCMVIIQGPVLSYLTKIWSGRRLIIIGSIILGCGFLTFYPAISWLAFVGAILIAMGNGLMWAPIVALLSKTGGKYQGAVQGLAESVGAAASIIGLVLGGMMYSSISGWLFVISGILIFSVTLLSEWNRRNK